MIWHSGRGLFAAFFLFTLSACASLPERPLVSSTDQLAARVDGFGSIRLWDDATPESWMDWRLRLRGQREAIGAGPELEILAISSGSDKGAFSAGYLNGWSESGKRPSFDIVSGVSTGSLIAPFAFLGSDYDPHLRQLYTEIEADMIYSSTPLKGLFGGPALASTEPLREMIARYADQAMIDAVAREHRLGRRLLVQTTNLDAQRGVVWDMGAIAASENTARYDLFRDVLLASSSIPGFFPPVFIDVASRDFSFSELHVDGGTTSSILAIPPRVIFGDIEDGANIEGRLTILYNGAIDPVYRVVKPDVFSILDSALTTSLKTADRRSIMLLQRYADQTGVVLEVQSIGEAAEDPDAELFDQQFMQRLYLKGQQRAVERYHPDSGNRTVANIQN